MQKSIKTESVADFIARGGSIKRVVAKAAKKSYRKGTKEACVAIDMSALPEALKIKYGMR